jgi:iron(III) transport system substrate-binding protein
VVEGETIASPALVKAACAEGSLTYYTVQTEADEQNIIAPFEEAFPCITVNIVASTSGPLFSRVQTEAAAGKVTGDVLLNSDAVAAAALKKANLIKAWTPPSSSKYPDDRKVDGVWYPGAGSLMYFIYNNQKVSKADAPKDWSDLTDPKWQGQISTSPATIGGTGWSVFYFLNQTFGKSYLEQLDKQKVTFFPSYSSVVSSVARGETSIGIECDLCDYRARTQQGAPLTPVYPTSGSVYVPYPMMLIAHSPHPKAAELFANWYVSKQGQEQVVKTRGAYSARADIGPAEGKPALSKVKVVAIPTDKVLADHDKFLSTYASIFG